MAVAESELGHQFMQDSNKKHYSIFCSLLVQPIEQLAYFSSARYQHVHFMSVLQNRFSAKREYFQTAASDYYLPALARAVAVVLGLTDTSPILRMPRMPPA